MSKNDAASDQKQLLHSLRVGWRNLFFQLCCCFNFLFWREIGFGCTYYYVLRVPYSCGVVLVFLVLEGNSFWCYVRTQCTIKLCGCAIFFVVAVNFVRIFLLNPNFLLEHRKFSSRTYAIVPQKYRELFMQVETCEQSYYSFNARWKKNFLYFLLTLYYYHQSHFNLRKFLLGFFFYRNNEIQTFYYCVSLSCF